MISPENTISVLKWRFLHYSRAVDKAAGSLYGIHEQGTVLNGDHTVFRLYTQTRELNVRLLATNASTANKRAILK